MTLWLSIAWFAAAVNLLLLAGLSYIWAQSYRQLRAKHTLGLLVFGAFLLVQNGLWLYFYRIHPAFIGWFVNTSTDVQIGMTLLCGLQTLALLALFRITWL